MQFGNFEFQFQSRTCWRNTSFPFTSLILTDHRRFTAFILNFTKSSISSSRLKLFQDGVCLHSQQWPRFHQAAAHDSRFGICMKLSPSENLSETETLGLTWLFRIHGLRAAVQVQMRKHFCQPDAQAVPRSLREHESSRRPHWYLPWRLRQ